MAKGIRRMMADDEIGRLDFLSFMNFAFSTTSRREKSELFAWLDKHDFARPKMMTQSIAVSFRKAPMPEPHYHPGDICLGVDVAARLGCLQLGKHTLPGSG